MNDLHQRLKRQCDACLFWDCRMPFQEAYSVQDESSVVQLGPRLGSGQDYMFPECYVGPESQSKLVTHCLPAAALAAACDAAAMSS